MRKLAAMLMLCAAVPAFAEDTVEITPATLQADFDSIAEDLVAAIDYKAVVPAEATGIAGFGFGLILNYTPVDDEAAWNRATAGQADISEIGLVGLGVTKGLPLGIDVGVFYSEVPSTNISMFGAEIRYAILKGGTASPALAVRAAYSKVSGIDSFDLESKSIDVSVSKGFALVTPYAGVGQVFGEADPNNIGTLKKADVEETKLFAGLRLGLGLFEITPEVEKIGDNTMYNLRLGFSFSL
jgi:hypothetical protein